jgi:general secretion pathway protein J
MTRFDRGFTLLELLIGLTLLGFILALLFGGFRLASRSWDAVTTRTESTSAEQLARSMARRLIAQAQPMRWKKGINPRIAFVGEPGTLIAITPISGPLGAGGLAVIELKAIGGPAEGATEGPFRLTLRLAPLRYQDEVFSDTLADSEEHLLLDGLTAVEFSYFGSEKPGTLPTWQSTWPNPDQLPKLVRLRLQSSEDGWTDLVASPMIAMSNCRWDSFYKRCM